jgi:predicted NodU family carbamoyl transferase
LRNSALQVEVSGQEPAVEGAARRLNAGQLGAIFVGRMELRSIARLLDINKTRQLGLAGGAFANVRLNRLVADKLPIDETFIFPAMGDDGMPAGGALCYLLRRDGLSRWFWQRHRPSRRLFGFGGHNEINPTIEDRSDAMRLY